jgi:uncharacterized membrane protein YraQ (UPF0718 family)
MKQMLIPTLVMVGVVTVLISLTYFRDPSLLATGLKGSGKLVLQSIPILILAFIIAGLVQVVIPKELISGWIGAESGWRGIMIGAAAGALTPGGPYATFPITAGFYKAGAGLGPVVAFLSAWALWQLARIPISVALLGPKVTLVFIASTFIFPPIAGYIAHYFFSRF